MSASRPGRWKKGESGNPSGRPKGPEPRARLEKLLREAASDGDGTRLEELLRKVIAQAIAGEAVQQKLILDRIDPATTKLDVEGSITAIITKQFVGKKPSA